MRLTFEGGQSEMNFSQALERLKEGRRVFRVEWGGRIRYVVLQKGYPDGVPINKNTSVATGIQEGTIIAFRPYFMMQTVDGSFVPWFPTQTDMLADDWAVA